LRIFGITGWKNNGKTRLVVGLVSHFSEQGLKVSTIKHAHHSFDIDHPGRDSYQHRTAGATEVIVASAARFAVVHELRGEEEPSLPQLLAKLSKVDLVLVEGFKRERHPKIEVVRKGFCDQPIALEDPTIVALASDYQVPGITLPIFDLDDIKTIAEFVAEQAVDVNTLC
jgi:molybdopterin-guanine dinucleotide biosynthesis protein B